MRYGESIHNHEKEFDDDELEDYSQEIVKIKKRPSNIPNGLSLLKHQNLRIDLPDTGKYQPASIHNSMPPNMSFLATTPSKSISIKSISHDSLAALRPKPGEIFFGKKNKKLI